MRRNRFLDPTLRIADPWTDEEDEILLVVSDCSIDNSCDMPSLVYHNYWLYYDVNMMYKFIDCHIRIVTLCIILVVNVVRRDRRSWAMRGQRLPRIYLVAVDTIV